MPCVGFCLLVTSSWYVASSTDSVAPVYAMSGEHVFDGSDENCKDGDIGRNSELPMAGSPYTLEAWVMPDEVMQDESFGIVGWGVPHRNSLNGFIFYRGSHSLRNIWWQNDLQAYLEKPLADGSYHHVAATWDGSVQRIFVDFVEIASKSSSGYAVSTTENFCVGVAWHQDGTRANFRGRIKDLKIWSVARDFQDKAKATEIPSDAIPSYVHPSSAIPSNEEPALAAKGKYRVHTQKGFLNIHSEPDDPFRYDNVVGRWHDGDIVYVISEPVQTKWGPWLQTSKGWSIQIYGNFHWLRPVLEEEPLPQKSSTDQASASQQESELDDEADYEGTLSLRVVNLHMDSDLHSKVRDLTSTYQEALRVGLQAYFGFVKVWFKDQTSSGRQLRSSHAEAKVHFLARGGVASLTYDVGLKTEIQDALDAAGADIILDSVSVQWKTQPSTPPQDSDPDVPSWYLVVFGVIALVIITLCLGLIVGLYKRYSRKTKVCVVVGQDINTLGRLQVVNPPLDVVQVSDAIKVKKDEDAASDSTAEGDTASEDTPTSGDEQASSE